MKNKKKELDVDFIGGQGSPPTKEEQRAISTFIKRLKENERRKPKENPKKKWSNLHNHTT